MNRTLAVILLWSFAMTIIGVDVPQIWSAEPPLAEVPAANYDEAKIPAFTLPDPLTFCDGTPVVTPKQWQKRRAELLELFAQNVYGKTPVGRPASLCWETTGEGEAFGGKAIRSEVRIFLDADKKETLVDLLIYTPKSVNADKKVPVVLGLNFRGNHTVTNDTGVALGTVWIDSGKNDRKLVAATATEETRGQEASRWCVEQLIERGYAVVTAYYCQIEPDFDGGISHGVRRTMSPPAVAEWGAIGVWAWGLSRIMDYIEDDGLGGKLDPRLVMLTGHSRLGKTALWAGAQDERFAVVVSNNSGCGGAALTRREIGETLWRMNTSFPHWNCVAARDYNERVNDLPVDQHELIALIAPRGVYIASAEEDRWADPRGEFLSGLYAAPVYKLLGTPGLGETNEMPPVGKSVGATIRYHIRSGKHDVTAFDWEKYIDFADEMMR
ncbi:MAG: acetylxylan esterase [Thermoguttaceae bacterium]